MPRIRWRHGLVLGMALAGHSGSAGAASQTARYSVRFDGTWSAATHPIDFPSNAHFSSLIGGTHDSSAHFWNLGDLASQGIRDLAERGLTSPLDLEVESTIAAGHAGVVIRGGGISPAPGTAGATFDISQTDPLVTLVSMIAPSPDWFVGVSALPLFSGGDWVDHITVPLAAYDAGTDCGTSYTAPNCVSSPAQPIASNGAAAFGNGTPLGTFTFTRIDSPSATAVPATSPAALAGIALVLLAAGVARARRRTPGTDAA
jgi:hypothetical protein